VLFFFLLTTCLIVCSSKIAIAEQPSDDEDIRTKVMIHPVKGEPELEKMLFIFRKAKNNTPPVSAGEDNPSYKLIAKGLRWASLPVSYGINSSTYFAVVEKGFEEWDNWSSKEIFNPPAVIIGGNLERDNSNTVSWQPLTTLFGSDVIAITQIIYNTRTKIILEFDMAFNTDLPWGIANPAAFDAQNITTHEAGHVLSLSDLYRLQTSELTMYGYATEGELKKQTLGNGDKLGLWSIFGK